MAKISNLKFHPTEQISERKENIKTYLVGPGLRHAFAASIPLHVQQEDGSWSPVNAVFQWDKESSGYISHGSRFTTACSVPNPAPFISVTDHKNHSLAWGIEEAGPVSPEIPERVKPETDDPAEAMFLADYFQAQGSLVCLNRACEKFSVNS